MRNLVRRVAVMTTTRGTEWRSLRESCGVSRERLAQLARCSVSTIVRLESGETRWPRVSVLSGIQTALRRIERADARLRAENPEVCK